MAWLSRKKELLYYRNFPARIDINAELQIIVEIICCHVLHLLLCKVALNLGPVCIAVLQACCKTSTSGTISCYHVVIR